MIFTVAVVIVNGEACVDPRLDDTAPVIRDVLTSTAHDPDSFETLSVAAVPQNVEEISSTVRSLIKRNSVDFILVVGGIGFEDSDCTPEAIDPLIKRPCVALVNRILANVQDPFLIRPSAGVPRRSLVVTLPGETENLHSALNYLITSAPGLIQLLKLLKTRRTASNHASGSSETRRATLNVTPGQVSPSTSSSNSVAARRTSESQTALSESPWRWFKKNGRESSKNSSDIAQRSATSSSVITLSNRVPRIMEPTTSITVPRRSLSPPVPATSETPWRCLEIWEGADIIAPNSSREPGAQYTDIPEARTKYFSLVASPNGELYMFGGSSARLGGLFRLEPDTRNSVATIRRVQAAGTQPSHRHAPAVWISSSLMVVWGGFDISPLGFSDTNIHVFNARTLTWTTYSTSGPAPSPRQHHAMAAVGTKIYVHGGGRFTLLSDFWCLDLSALSNPQGRQNLQWQDLSFTLSQCPPNDSPGGHMLHKLVACGSDIMLLGTSSNRNAVYSYSTETMQWKNCCRLGLGRRAHSGAIHLGDTIYLHAQKFCKMYSISDNLWLENPSTFSRKNLKGPMTVIDSKIYVLGVSEEKDSKLALFELEPGKIWLPTQAEYDAAQAERIEAEAARQAEHDIAEALGS